MLQNQENMTKIKELRAKADTVRLGGDLQAGVPISYESEYGVLYEGTVVFKRPTMQDYIRIGGIKSEYLREAGVTDLKLVDNLIKYIAQVIATLSVVIVKCPEWLMDLQAINEPDVLYHVYDEYEVWEKSFRKLPTKPLSGDSTAAGREEDVDS